MVKTEWNLGLLYRSHDDPAIARDLARIEKACKQFEKKYKNDSSYLSDEGRLCEALTDYESLYEKVASPKPLIYFELAGCLASGDARARSEIKRISLLSMECKNRVIFFELALGTMAQETQRQYLKSKKLAHFHSFLQSVFEKSAHQLSEPEERILNLTSIPAHQMWVNDQEKLIAGESVRFKGKDIPISGAIEKISSLPARDRRELHSLVMKKLKSVAFFGESEINAVYTTKKIHDELRKFKEPYSATLLEYQDPEEVVLNLVDTVTGRFDVSRRFYALKARLLGVKKLAYADRNAHIGALGRKFGSMEAVSLVQNAFSKVGKRYESIFKSFLENGQIDFFSRKGKTSGAFSAGSINLPTYVLLNHEDSIRSVTTIAHEMGHSFHTELSKSQSPLYQGYGFSIAEVASTLFENFIYEELMPLLSEKDRIILLHDMINDDIQTIFRQIAFFNFELELHRRVRREGGVPKEEIAALLNKHTAAYLGPVFELDPDDGYYFLLISQIRRFFYVYSYAYGNLVSRALFKRYKEDNRFIEKIEQFLSAGCSAPPHEIFKSIGIDIKNPSFFEEGIKTIEEDISKLEKLAAL